MVVCSSSLYKMIADRTVSKLAAKLKTLSPYNLAQNEKFVLASHFHTSCACLQIWAWGLRWWRQQPLGGGFQRWWLVQAHCSQWAPGTVRPILLTFNKIHSHLVSALPSTFANIMFQWAFLWKQHWDKFWEIWWYSRGGYWSQLPTPHWKCKSILCSAFIFTIV